MEIGEKGVVLLIIDNESNICWLVFLNTKMQHIMGFGKKSIEKSFQF